MITMSKTDITRRSLLKKSLLGVAGTTGLVSLLITKSSCNKPCGRRRGNKIIVLPPYENPRWQDISDFTDGSLENGFNFDFGEYVESGNFVEINNREYSLDSIGAVIQHRGKQFTITNLNRKENGISIDLIEGNDFLAFNSIGDSQRINLDEREYTITLGRIESSEGFPQVSLIVNGNIINLEEGKAHLGDLSLCLNLREYQSTGRIELFLSHHHLSSRPDLGDDTEFSALEKTLILSESHDMPREQYHENKYNNQTQSNSYFRLDAIQGALGTIEPIRFRRIEKIRVNTQGISTPSRFATSHDVEIKERDRQQAQREIPQEFFDQSLENSFILDFSEDPIETRTGGLENQVPGLRITYPQEMFSYRILTQTPEGEKEFLIRYIGVDTSLTPTSRGDIFYPRNAIFTEILENPIEVIFQPNIPQLIEASDGEYILTLREVIIPGAGEVSRTQQLRLLEYLFEIEKNGKTQQLCVRALHYASPNRTGSLNIDPDLSPYINQSPTRVRSAQSHSFFISEKKFSSVADFYDDNQFSGQKAIAAIHNDSPARGQISAYTLANRFNGEIQPNAYFRVLADFGVQEFQRIPNTTTRYRIIENPVIQDPTQFEQGYILRIHRIEKINLEQ